MKPGTCHTCGRPGHFAAECPYTRELTDPAEERKPPHCGICDPVTRQLLLSLDGPFTRCPECHPLRGRVLRQHRRCPACRMVVYSWDTHPCGAHAAPDMADRRLRREQIDAIMSRPRQ